MTPQTQPQPLPQPIFDRSECGYWQQNYTQLHHDILSGKLLRRTVISIPVEAGIADRLCGTISEFYFAFLTGRAFLIVGKYGHLPPFEAAFEQPNIKWSVTNTIPDSNFEHLKYTYQGVRGFSGKRDQPASLDPKQWASIFQVNGWEYMNDLFFDKQMDSVYPDAENIMMATNRGRSYRSFENPHNRYQLERAGLQPQHMFRCAIEYLFQPTAATMSLMKPYLPIMEDESILKIDINIRAGDTVMDGGESDDPNAWRNFQSYFDCAQEIENSRVRAGQKVVWYLMSDSLSVRLSAKRQFGEKILTDTSTRHVHPDCAFHNPAECKENIINSTIIDAVSQLYVFRLANFHIVSRGSGFGIQGAWMAHRDSVTTGQSRTCGKFEYDNLDELSMHNGGV